MTIPKPNHNKKDSTETTFSKSGTREGCLFFPLLFETPLETVMERKKLAH